MSLRRIALADFDEWVRLNGHKYPKDLIDGLTRHPRFTRFIDTMVSQLQIIMNRKVFVHRRRLLKEATYCMAELFATLIKQHRDEHLMNDITKSMLRKEATKYDDAEAELAAEGIIIDDGRETKTDN